MANSNAKDNVVVKDLNGNYILYQTPRNTVEKTDSSNWTFIQRITENQYNQYFVTNKNTIFVDRSQNSGSSGNTAVSEPMAFIVMATTLVIFSLTKKLKSLLA